MTNELSLAGVGWVADQPTGNRLLWSWPEDAANAGYHVSPSLIFVERAPLHARYDPRLVSLLGPAAGAPPQLWTQLGDVTLSGATPVALPLAGPVQAACFTYGGPPARVQAFHGAQCVATRLIADGDLVALHASALELLTITASQCQLQSLATLDLYSTPALDYEIIAEIDLGATAAAPFAEAVGRYPSAATLDDGKWTELQTLWATAWAEPVGAPGPEDGAPNAWHELQLVLGARWEHAVLCGLGFVDGPYGGQSTLDTTRDLLMGPMSAVYRVRDAHGRVGTSNVVYSLGGPAPELPFLAAPGIQGGLVRLGGSGSIYASWDVAWGSSAPEIIGVEVRETRVVDGVPTNEQYGGRGRRATDPPGAGRVHRDEQVDAPEVAVAAAVRAQDGFDRVGQWSSVSPLTTLAIDHHPQPPSLQAATNDGATACLVQYPPADWAPDNLVAMVGGTVRFYRRVADRVRFQASVLQVVPLGDLVAVKLDGSPPPNPSAFAGGQITIGAMQGLVSAVTWPTVVVSTPHGEGPVAAVTPGVPAELSQSPSDIDLFAQVHEQSAEGLPATISFPDPLPPAAFTQVIEYRAQVAFGGQTGPLGAPVQALRLPASPNVPPAFTVTTLGVDFYARTIVQLVLTNPSNDLLDVWWADGDVDDVDFPRRSVPGDAGVRSAEGGRVLFDTLSLPIPNKVERPVTIGVQAVNAADGRSGFATVLHTLPAAP